MKLTAEFRRALRRLAERIVDCPDEDKELARAYAKAAPMIRKAVDKQFPPADMDVLKKYGNTNATREIYLRLAHGGDTDFSFAGTDPALHLPRSFNTNWVLVDEKTTELFEAWARAKDAAEKARKEKLGKYLALIESSTTMEQVLKVWPEAEELCPRIEKNLPVALSEADLAAITADSRRRLSRKVRADAKQAA